MNWGFFLIQIAIMAGVALFLHWRTHRVPSQPHTPRPSRNAVEMQRIAHMRARGLSTPLAESARPRSFSEIIGQEEGIRALKAALCGPNPQHVLLYGPPGVGKTCAARLVLEEARHRPDSPFNEESKFVEVDATCVRFDERAIADPLLGSVHDPIYQGAGSLGAQGVPQPKPGAVTRAHCGILFLDEIGELHPMQMNKLLKVLEDRTVKFESAYYSPDNGNIPQHIHDIFQNGLPADFRLVGATTRRPEEMPPALRSRCLELFFSALGQKELMQIAEGAAQRAGFCIEEEALSRCARHAESGRDAVNIVQLCCGLAHDEGRARVECRDVDWVTRICHYAPRMEPHMRSERCVGCATGLAVAGAGRGLILEIECSVAAAAGGPGSGTLVLNGVVEEEELDLRDRKLRRKSTARGSVENVLAALGRHRRESLSQYDIRFNIPGGIPVDGPSAGIALAIALESALSGAGADPLLAATGELTISGEVRPVGGVREKLAAAEAAGATRALIPAANWEEDFAALSLQVIRVETLVEVLAAAFSIPEPQGDTAVPAAPMPAFPAAASAAINEQA